MLDRSGPVFDELPREFAHEAAAKVIAKNIAVTIALIHSPPFYLDRTA